jgi:Cu/Ag efflux protein CusF
MKATTLTAAVVAFAASLLVACGDAPEPEAGGAVEATVEGGEHAASGTVNSVDPAAGTINVSHEAVASAGWPAMTMNFRLAEPGAAAELEPGQRIEFRFTTEGGGTITRLEPAD